MALKCDLREAHQDEEDGGNESKRPMIQYQQGLEVAQRIKALRYLGEQDLKSIFKIFFPRILICATECSAMKNRGVNEAFTEAARVALTVKDPSDSSGGWCKMM